MPISVAGEFVFIGRYFGQCSEVLIIPDKFTSLCLSGLVSLPDIFTFLVDIPDVCLPAVYFQLGR